ncbi:MAG TPA: NAD(P)/FAD-dependent oxidoreductase [Bauldia sp.]
MAVNDFEVVVVGAGAAGIAAARKLKDAGVDTLLVEARDRIGGRAWTVDAVSGVPLDLGCGWLHSADHNPWREIAEAQGRTIDRTPPPWARAVSPTGAAVPEMAAYGEAIGAFRGKLADFSEGEADVPASAFLEPGSRWNGMLGAVSTFFSGAELDRVSTRDLARYDDTGINWRVVEGYGRVVVESGAGLDVRLSCPVQRVDRRGKRLRVDTADGPISADTVIVTLPTSLLAASPDFFMPPLPDKTEAAAGLPLGLADKLFLSLDHAEDFESESRAFGHTDRVATAAYHFRPFGRPHIEAYFGGTLAADLERAGAGAFFDFAVAELVGLFGEGFRARVEQIGLHAWAADPFARGSYSYALPGRADERTRLADPVENRLFFAGEACSTADYSTAHGALLTGKAAAERAITRVRLTT